MHFRPLVRAAIALASVATALAAQPRDLGARLAPIIRRLDSLVALDPRLAISAAAVENGKVTWQAGFGVTNGRAASPNTVYRVASVSRSITAVGAMRLVQEGKLDLDAPVSRYLGPAAIRLPSGDTAKLTTRRLLSMTAGIPQLVRFYWADSPTPLGESAMMTQFAAAAFPPGERFHDSNLSFEIVQAVIARVAGVSFEEFMQSQIFAPAGMTNTRLRPTASGAHSAVGYAGETPLLEGGLEPDGGAGFRSTAHDLAALAASLVSPSGVLAPRSAAQLWGFSERNFYGLGWWRDLGRPSESIAIADGAAAGGGGTIALDPQRKHAAIVVLNRGTGASAQLAGDLLRALSPGAPASVAPQIPAALGREPFTGGPAWEGRWCGTIVSERESTAAKLIVTGASMSLGVGPAIAVPGSAPVNADGIIRSTFSIPLGFAAVATTSHRLQLFARAVADTMRGYVMAESTPTRPLFNLPFLVTLRRGGSC